MVYLALVLGFFKYFFFFDIKNKIVNRYFFILESVDRFIILFNFCFYTFLN